MKYIVIISVVILAFAAGTQVSSANGQIAIPAPAEKAFSVNGYANEWLIPDNAARMMDFHNSLNH